MARIRSIKPSFFRHAGLFDAEKASGLPLRLAFAGLWTAADRAGRFAWKARELKLDCLPFDDVDFEAVLSVLAEHGFIRKYSVNGEVFGSIPSWRRHQAINLREAESEIPAPPEEGGEAPATAKKEPAPAGKAFLVFETQGKPSAWTLTEEQVGEWQELYPGLDVKDEVRKAKAWTAAHTANRKTASGMPRFLVGWLNRAVRGGGGGGRGTQRDGLRSAGFDEQRREQARKVGVKVKVGRD